MILLLMTSRCHIFGGLPSGYLSHSEHANARNMSGWALPNNSWVLPGQDNSETQPVFHSSLWDQVEGSCWKILLNSHLWLASSLSLVPVMLTRLFSGSPSLINHLCAQTNTCTCIITVPILTESVRTNPHTGLTIWFFHQKKYKELSLFSGICWVFLNVHK